ncbi:MAG: NERD domain-containing protein [Candidatus Aenigmarchaeota archaeon]|nr:NERD domain-containing protein [Candidatus Aenigmarchaeota archaeon]
MELLDIESAIRKGVPLEAIAERLDWREFEMLCSAILNEHGWKIKRNFHFKTGSRHEIDIVALKPDKILLVDCKHWGIRPGKKYQLKAAAEKQSNRAGEFQKARFLWRKDRQKSHTIIITLFEEEILQVEGVWIVPVFKLNAFLLDIESYLE